MHVKRRRISWGRESCRLKHLYCRWIIAIGQIIANVATSITTTGEAARGGDQKRACKSNLTLSAKSVGM
jgi:hypothetical protein